MAYNPDEIPNRIMFGGECNEPVCFKPCKKCKGKVSPTMTELENKVEELKAALRIRQQTAQSSDSEDESIVADIYSPAGTKLVFLGENGYSAELLDALMVLEKGKTYTLKASNIGHSYTDFELEEFPGQKWNSVMFSKVPQ